MINFRFCSYIQWSVNFIWYAENIIWNLLKYSDLGGPNNMLIIKES